MHEPCEQTETCAIAEQFDAGSVQNWPINPGGQSHLFMQLITKRLNWNCEIIKTQHSALLF